MPRADAPIGWVIVPAQGIESTTGGGNGRIVTARTAEELVDYAKRNEPLTMYYRRVDQITDSGIIEGEVWRFRTK